MNRERYNFSIITPIVMAGANKNMVELRTQSIKGILRWWFRFYKSSFLGIKELRKVESDVFGSTENAALFSMQLLNEPTRAYDTYLCMNDRRKRGEKNAAKNYNAIKRRAYLPPHTFQLDFRSFPHFKYNEELENSLMLLSLFGGIGARWRRGFGSVQIENKNFSFNGENLEKMADDIQSKIKKLKGNLKQNDFINISNTKIYLIKPKNNFFNSWNLAMDDLRDNFYRKLKENLKVDKIAYKPYYGERTVSPLIIQIKKLKDNYFGVILVWDGWLTDFESPLRSFQNYYEIRKVEL
jgi:CRISPR-associated protein Cmr1